MEEHNKYLIRYIQRNYRICGDVNGVVLRQYINNIADIECKEGRHKIRIKIDEARLDELIMEERLIEFMQKNGIVNGGEEI